MKYTIGQIAKQVGLPTKTIRFYEEEGVITPAQRGENGYRLYQEITVKELQMIKYARGLGIPLLEIKRLMKGCEEGHCSHSKQFVDENINRYLGELDSKIGQLNTLKNKLIELQKTLKTQKANCPSNEYCCDLLHQLIDLDQGGKNA
ncbi:MerR family transcriptional regulator [Patescibacteria group bacterium]|nr:MerR family transcriptional regulator [Patescibacteria group bacterium]